MSYFISKASSWRLFVIKRKFLYPASSKDISLTRFFKCVYRSYNNPSQFLISSFFVPNLWFLSTISYLFVLRAKVAQVRSLLRLNLLLTHPNLVSGIIWFKRLLKISRNISNFVLFWKKECYKEIGKTGYLFKKKRWLK